MNTSNTITKRFYLKLGVEGMERLTDFRKTNAMISAVAPMIARHDRVLDLACGYGRITIPLSKKGYEIEGIDLMPNFIAEARLRAAQAGVSPKFTVGDMRNLPYADATFNKILSLWSSFSNLLTWHDQLKGVREIYRVLTPGGMAFIEMINGEQLKYKQSLRKYGFGEQKRLLHEQANGVEDTLYYHDRASLRRLCSESNVTKYEVRFMNIACQRRLVMFLYK